MYAPTRRAGFTLLELLVSIAVIALLLGLTLPGLSQWLGRVRMESATAELHSALRLARTQAVAMRTDVKFCPMVEQVCVDFSDDRAMVFADLNANDQLDNGDRPLQEIQLQGVRLWLRVSAGRSYLRYRPSGDSKEWGSLIICNPLTDAPASRQLVISLAGRVRIAPDADGDGLAENSSGNPVYCP